MATIKSKIDSISQDARVAVWGAGGMGKKLMDETSLSQKNIVRVYDSDKEKRGKLFGEYPVSSFNPRDVEKKKVDTIVITTSVAQENILYYLEPYTDNVNIVTLFDRQIRLPCQNIKNISGKLLLHELSQRIRHRVFGKKNGEKK